MPENRANYDILLDCNLLGPFNDALEKMEVLWSDLMSEFYRRHSLKKSGHSAGGKFNGVDIRLIFKESSLQELTQMLQSINVITTSSMIIMITRTNNITTTVVIIPPRLPIPMLLNLQKP